MPTRAERFLNYALVFVSGFLCGYLWFAMQGLLNLAAR